MDHSKIFWFSKQGKPDRLQPKDAGNQELGNQPAVLSSFPGHYKPICPASDVKPSPPLLKPHSIAQKERVLYQTNEANGLFEDRHPDFPRAASKKSQVSPPLASYLRSNRDPFPLSASRGHVTPSEAKAMMEAIHNLYDLVVQRQVQCPYPFCRAWFEASREDLLQKHLVLQHELPNHCNFCSAIFKTIRTQERQLHLKEKHPDLCDIYREDVLDKTDEKDNGSIKRASRLFGEDWDYSTYIFGPHTVFVPGGSDVRGDKKNQESSAVPVTQPVSGSVHFVDVETEESADDGDEGSEGRKSQQQAKKKPRVRARADSVEGQQRKRRRHKEHDSTYRPRNGDEDNDEDEDDVSDSSDHGDRPGAKERGRNRVRRGSQASRHGRAPLNDISYRPISGLSQDYEDDADEELRRSAVPEWAKDPFDPTGKRKRVLRESAAPTPTPPSSVPGPAAPEEKTANVKKTKFTPKAKATRATKAPQTSATTSVKKNPQKVTPTKKATKKATPKASANATPAPEIRYRTRAAVLKATSAAVTPPAPPPPAMPQTQTAKEAKRKADTAPATLKKDSPPKTPKMAAPATAKKKL